MTNSRSSNIKFIYLYRDASNYKNWGEVIFSNPAGLQPQEIEGYFHRCFTGDDTFIASQVRLPEVFFYDCGEPTIDDHCFHEFSSIEATDLPATDKFRRSILEFVRECANAAAPGWLGFDPQRPDRRFIACARAVPR